MCVCVVVCVWRGGGVPSISFFLLHMLDTNNYCFPLKIYRVYPGALLRHFIEYTILRGLVVLPLYGARGEAPVAENGFRAFQRAKMSQPQRHATKHY